MEWLWRGASAAAAPLLLVALTSATAAAAAPPTARAEVPVTAVDERLALANNSPVLAVDPRDKRVLVAASRRDSPDFGCALHVSGDSGRSWLPANPIPKLPEGVEKCYGPELSFGADGRLWLLFAGLGGRGNSPVGIFLASSTGGDFTDPLRVLGPERYMARLAADRRTGRLHLVWLEAGADPTLGGLPPVANPIMAAHSDDGGRTFSPPVQVSQPGRQRVVAPALTLGPDGAVHVAYYDLQADAIDYQGLEGPAWEGHWSMVVSSSGDGGRTFSRHRVVDDALVPPSRVMLIFTMPPPSVAADDEGRVYVAWHDARHGDWDAFLARSVDGGDHWQPPLRLNDDPPGRGRHQYLPRLSLSPGGRLDAVFYDRRDDPQNLRNDVFFTSSSDGGRRFTANLRLTTDPSDSRVGPRYPIPSARGLVDVGSRLGLVSWSDGALAAWADTRNSHPESPQQDVFATTVDMAAPDPTSHARLWPALVAVVATGAVLSVATWRWRRRRRPVPA